jgi:hypothetical protein
LSSKTTTLSSSVSPVLSVSFLNSAGPCTRYALGATKVVLHWPLIKMLGNKN